MDYTPTTGLKWRILSKEGNKVELIAERGDNNSFYLQGYQGYNNAVALLNNACNKMYVNSELGAVTARNLKIEDIEAHYTGEGATNQEYTPTSGKYYPEIFALEEGGNIDNKGYGSLKRSDMPSTRLNSEGYIVQTERKQANPLKGKYTYYSFTMASDNMNRDGGDGSLYTSLFSHTRGNYQWLASRCVYLGSSDANFYVFYVYSSSVSARNLYYSNSSVERRRLCGAPRSYNQSKIRTNRRQWRRNSRKPIYNY